MNEKKFDFVAQAAMLDGELYGEVEKLRSYIRDVKTAAETVPGEKLCVPLSEKTMTPADLRQCDEITADRADLSQSTHRDGDSVRVPRVVA
ncbi:MAG: hypothetical protein IJX93_01855 [Clostridia bacterium]|nr:hypothetical protein [Clostridia bacterium]MBQ8332500.1 hypothetical protein [Clostridia bacterium]MBQ8369935.1 hypothetical protein [Clostridia bacterium]MBQ8511181.1 hypothetical protein [Clostridia bacterium]